MTDRSTNAYCQVLGIQVPDLEQVKDYPRANYYSLLLAVLLERGAPVTLPEAAERLEQAGVAERERALASLKHCKPARAPIYRDGDRYALDPHDDEADLWAFRLGLRPPKVSAPRVVTPARGPLPSPDHPLTEVQLDEAWKQGVPRGWSAQRLALCVLDCRGGAMRPEEVVAFIEARGQGSGLSMDSARYWRRGAAIRVGGDGLWAIVPGHDALRSARQAVRERIEAARRNPYPRTDPAVSAAIGRQVELRRQAHARELARMRRVLIHAFPAARPEAVALLDPARYEIATFVGTEIDEVIGWLANYEIIAAVEVRALLRALGFDPGERRLGELGPPQKSKRLNRAGRTLKITNELLIQGSCGISRPFGDEAKLREYLSGGRHTQLRRRLEADVKSLFALYQYGRLHGSVRLRWGFLDERIPVPWVHRDEPTLYELEREALERGLPLEVVVGNAPGWADPWSRVQRVQVRREAGGWRTWLVDAESYPVDEDAVQLARLVEQD